MQTLENHIYMNPKQVDELMIISGFFCRAEHNINAENFKKLLNTVETLACAEF